MFLFFIGWLIISGIHYYNGTKKLLKLFCVLMNCLKQFTFFALCWLMLDRPVVFWAKPIHSKLEFFHFSAHITRLQKPWVNKLNRSTGFGPAHSQQWLVILLRSSFICVVIFIYFLFLLFKLFYSFSTGKDFAVSRRRFIKRN